MLPYFLVFTPIALMASVTPQRRVYPAAWFTVFVVLVVFVGLRHHVGMDWNNYLRMIQRANLGSWSDALLVAEPGYATLLYFSGQMGWGVYGAYLIGTLIFAVGLFQYAKITPNPWITLVVAFPYLIVVVAMSGARQTVAVGVLLWLFAKWHKISILHRIGLVLLAMSFHASALVLLLFVALDLRIGLIYRFLIFTLLVGIVGYGMSTSATFDFYQQAYVTGGDDGEPLQAGGAMFHVLLNAGPAALAMVLGSRARAILLPDKLHRNLAYVALSMVPLAVVASVVASRFSIYLFPVSMMIISSLPVLVRSAQQRLLIRVVAVVFFALILYVWLGFAKNSRAWLNYSNALFIEPSQLVLCCK